MADVYLLHPNWLIRKRFYQLVLVPTDHAIENKGWWYFSDEYKEALRDELPLLQALLKLIL
jgi:hypothetical protein